MKKVKVQRTLAELIAANQTMSLYLDNLSRGREATPHSWLYENEKGKTDSEKAQKTLQRWIPIMEAANKKSKFGEVFNQFDLKQVEKFGPQGLIPPFESKEVSEVLEPLYTPSEYDDPSKLSHLFDDAKLFAKEAFGTKANRCRPLSFESVVVDMRALDKLTTNSGFPRFIRRNTVEDIEIRDARTGRAYDYPAIILFRQYYGKLRPVWMFPMSLNLVEAQFSQVIQKTLQESPAQWIQQYLSPWDGFEYVKQTLTSQWSGQQVDGGDTTKMDAHMRPAQLELVYQIVKWLFQRQYWDDLHKSLMHVCEIDLLCSSDEILTGTHGLASGSGWTQLSETVLQLFMAWRAKVHGQGIGDDFYWITDMDAEQLVDYLGEYGLPANPSKQTVSDNELHFLQRLNHQGFFSREDGRILGAYYPTIRALGSMLLPEKFHKPKDWDSDMFCTRNYMILENCVDDPCFDEFLAFVVHGHKDMIPFAKKSSSELAAIQRRASKVPGLNPSYNQEKREKPLSSFVSINLAREL